MNMCGRYNLIHTQHLAKRFNVKQAPKDLKPNYNVAPGQQLPIIVNHGNGNEIEFAKWGLIPVWAKDVNIGYKMINARAETLEEKSTWKRPFHKQRCIVPASGFYEWRKFGKEKQPFCIHVPSADLVGFAGLYDIWKDAEGYPIISYTIITTTANKLVEPIHDRMPVILSPEAEDAWLDPAANDNIGFLEQLLRPYPHNQMNAYPISTEVNKPQNNNVEITQEVTL